jgi:hypothetical protein
MRINSPYITGSATITGNLCVQGTILGTITGVASTASYAETLDGLDSTQFVQTGSFNSYTSSASSSVGSLSGSVATTTSGLSSSIGSLSSSVATTTSGLGGRITTIEGRYATTGSNTFIGNQVITGSLYITTDLIVQGSSSLQNITASAVSIGTNTVILNTDTPAVRFAGISVQDSGSNVGVTGSIFWDGLCNKWVYSNPSGIGYSGGMLLSGPRTATLGSESPLTCNYIAKSGGGDHLYDSCIQEVSGSVTIGGTLCTSGVVCGASGIFSSTSYSNLYLDGTNASGWGNNIAFKSQGTDFGYVGSIGSLVGSTTKDMTIWSTTGNGFRVHTNGNNPRLCIDSNGISTFACQICTVALVTADLRYTGTGYITYDTSASGTSCLIFRQNGTEKMRISECGYVAITGNEGLSCVPYLQGMSFGWNRTNGQGESMINWTNAGGGSACDLVFNFRDSSTLYERLRIASTGTATFSGNVNVTVANTPEVLLTHSNTSKTFLMAVDGSNAFFRANSTNNILFQYGGGTNALSINGSTGVACFSNTVCANAGLISNTLTISCTSGDDRAMYMSLNCSANYNSGDANTIARSVSSLKFLWYNNCWEIGATRGDDTAIQALVFAKQGSTYLAMTCHGITNFSCQICVKEAVYVHGSFPGVKLDRSGTTAQSDINWRNAGTSVWSIGTAVQAIGSNLDFYNYTLGGNVLKLTTTGEACFKYTVCAPRFVGPVTGVVTGFIQRSQTGCIMSSGSSDVTVYFTSGIVIAYGVNDYTVVASPNDNAAAMSSTRVVIPYNYYAGTLSTTVLASYIDSANSHSVLAVSICKLVNSNTNCLAVRFAKSSGNVTNTYVQVTTNGMNPGND